MSEWKPPNSKDATLAKLLVWDTATDHGRLLVSLPAKIEPREVEEFHEIFDLVMRGVRRRVDPSRHRQMIWTDIASPLPPPPGSET